MAIFGHKEYMDLKNIWSSMYVGTINNNNKIDNSIQY